MQSYAVGDVLALVPPLKADWSLLVESKVAGKTFVLFVLLLLRPKSTAKVMVGAVSSPNHTFFLGKLEQAVNQYLVHILSLVTDNNPS